MPEPELRLTGQVNLNGELVPAAEARVSVFDHGLLFSWGFFETLRVYGGRPFRLGEHLDRLRAGAAELRFELPWPREELAAAVEATAAANALAEGAVRLTITRGVGPPAPDLTLPARPAYFVIARAWQPLSEEAYGRGFRVIVASERRDERSLFARVKTLNYGIPLLARREAREAGVEEALLLNQAGMVAEAGAANVFAVRGEELLTPPPAAGCLPGIARATVLEAAEELGIPAREAAFPPEALQQAEEAFLTSSLIEVMPLTEVAGAPVGAGRPGPLTLRLREAYRELVRRELGLGGA